MKLFQILFNYPSNPRSLIHHCTCEKTYYFRRRSIISEDAFEYTFRCIGCKRQFTWRKLTHHIGRKLSTYLPLLISKLKS